jgi:hypothetical protein
MRVPHPPAKPLAICCALFVGTLAFGVQEQDAADVSGAWHLELTLPSGRLFSGTLTLHQEDGEVSGTWRHEGGDEDSEVSGEVVGELITFYWLMDLHTGGGNVRAVVRGSFEGSIEGDVMTGTARFRRRSDDLDWTAKRTG